MSVSRLLRAEQLAERSAPREIEPTFEEMVRRANEGRVWAPLPLPEAPPEALPEPPVPALPPPAKSKTEPPPAQQPRAWHEDYCRWRQRTAADDAADEENHNVDIDDPLGIYR